MAHRFRGRDRGREELSNPGILLRSHRVVGRHDNDSNYLSGIRLRVERRAEDFRRKEPENASRGIRLRVERRAEVFRRKERENTNFVFLDAMSQRNDKSRRPLDNSGKRARPLIRIGFGEVARRLRGARKPVPPPKPELSLEDKPLRCGGMLGSVALAAMPHSGWKAVVHDDYRRSYVSYLQAAFPCNILRDWWEKCLHKINFSKPRVGKRLLPRSAAWLTTSRCKCQYRYSGTKWPAQAMDPWFLELTDQVCRACGIRERPNSCNANLYENGDEAVGWHTDDEHLFNATKQDSLILSLSLGATRLFELKPNDDPDDSSTLNLGDGDICTMEGLLQKHYCHRVPKERNARGSRINLTWRWVVNHDDECPFRAGGEIEPLAAVEGGSSSSLTMERRERSISQPSRVRLCSPQRKSAAGGAAEHGKHSVYAEPTAQEAYRRRSRVSRFGDDKCATSYRSSLNNGDEKAGRRSSSGLIVIAREAIESSRARLKSATRSSKGVLVLPAKLENLALDDKLEERVTSAGSMSKGLVTGKVVAADTPVAAAETHQCVGPASLSADRSLAVTEEEKRRLRAARFSSAPTASLGPVVTPVAKASVEVITSHPPAAPSGTPADVYRSAAKDKTSQGMESEMRRKRKLRFAEDCDGTETPAVASSTAKRQRPTEIEDMTATVSANPAAKTEGEKKKERAARFAG